jgi:hypothetical protein
MVKDILKIVLGDKLYGKLSLFKHRHISPIVLKLHQIFFILFGKRCYSVVLNTKGAPVTMGYVVQYIFATKEDAESYCEHVVNGLASLEVVEIISWWTRNPYKTSIWEQQIKKDADAKD